MSKAVRAKGTFQKRFSGFCPLRGYPPPLPPQRKNILPKKTLAERGGTPPPLTDKPQKFSQKMRQKGLKLAFFGQKKYLPKLKATFEIVLNEEEHIKKCIEIAEN